MSSRLLPITALCGIVLGGIFALTGNQTGADIAWGLVIALLIVPETWAVIKTLRAGQVGVDSIALLAMVTALIMQEYLAGAVVALMLSGGNALEAWAAGRSRRELSALLKRAPRSAQRLIGETLEEVAVDQLVPGDRVSVRTAEVLPVDGLLISTFATLDESALTGESLPVGHAAGGRLRSGTTNAGDPFVMEATASASESSYERLIALVRSAENDRAPFVRMADRFAVVLLVLTLVIGGLAWAISGESIRFLAVLVVATPCPLILAAPIAFIAGVSRAAARGVIVKSGGAIEGLGRARSVLLDKTGTLTLGTPQISEIIAQPGFTQEQLLRLTASIDQMSTHVLAEALVEAAKERGLELQLPAGVKEVPGEGMLGEVDGHSIVIGTAGLIERHAERHRASARHPGHAEVHIGIDGRYAGTIVLADELREEASSIQPQLLALGVKRVTMLTGDHAHTAHFIAEAAGISEVRADQSPEDKVAAVREYRSDPELTPVVMVGDGINDAPALALADVGIAMSTSGVTASAEAADVVVTVPEISRVVEAIAIGRRSNAIALQSVAVGIGLSVGAMGFAAAGMITPVAGALLQEVIDIAVILNALRALR